MHKYVNPDAKLKQFIKIYANHVNDDFCDLILSEYTKNDAEWYTSCVMHSSGKKVSDNNIRKSRELFITGDEVIKRNFETRKKIDEDLFNIFTTVMQDYVNTVQSFFNVTHDVGYHLLAYTPGCHFKEHVDILSYPQGEVNGFVPVANGIPRQISLSLFLNEEYEGGELLFFDGTYSIPNTKGTIVLFPSNHLFPHQVSEVTSGCRYSIVTWFC